MTFAHFLQAEALEILSPGQAAPSVSRGTLQGAGELAN